MTAGFVLFYVISYFLWYLFLITICKPNLYICVAFIEIRGFSLWDRVTMECTMSSAGGWYMFGNSIWFVCLVFSKSWLVGGVSHTHCSMCRVDKCCDEWCDKCWVSRYTCVLCGQFRVCKLMCFIVFIIKLCMYVNYDIVSFKYWVLLKV